MKWLRSTSTKHILLIQNVYKPNVFSVTSSSLLLCSSGVDQSSSGQCTDINVPEGAAVLPHVPAERGKQQVFLSHPGLIPLIGSH